MTAPAADPTAATGLVALIGFGRALRAGGIAVGVDQLETLAAGLGHLPAITPGALYLAARTTLLTRHEDQVVFDEVFARWFGVAPPGGPRPMPRAPRHRPEQGGTMLASLMAARAGAADPEVPLGERTAATATERLARKDFAACTDEERERIARVLAGLRLELTVRRSHRRVRARRGPHVDLSRALRLAARHGGAVLVVPRTRRKLKRRPLVVLADISGSMELYARLLLQFLHTVTRHQRATEVFAFGTRLTRITPQLQLRDVDAAIAEAGRQLVDYAGGTRIGDCLHTFERRHARRVVTRGAVVLVVSDGLDTGDPDRLAAVLRRLRGRSHRLVWLNPLVGGEGYQPAAAGMAAALPHIDDLLSARDLGSLEALARHLASIPRRRGTTAALRPPRSS